MNPIIKKVIRENLLCLDCDHKFHIYVLPGDTYGRLMGRTPVGEFAEFNSWEDPVFDEVSAIVQGMVPKLYAPSEYLHKILGLACDLSPKGHRFDFEHGIHCPACGSTNVYYTSTDNPIFETIEVPQVTHRNWSKRGQQEKRDLIKDGLKAIGWRK